MDVVAEMGALPGKARSVSEGNQRAGAGDAYGATLLTKTAGIPRRSAYKGASSVWI